jgi:hypothetical protein
LAVGSTVERKLSKVRQPNSVQNTGKLRGVGKNQECLAPFGEAKQ